MKKRIILTESEKESILNLHSEFKKRLVEQATTERWNTKNPCDSLGKGPKCEDKFLQVQMKINDKCPTDKLPTKLVEDGIWGPKTNKAFIACGGVISGAQQGGAQQGGAQQGGAQQGGAQQGGAQQGGAQQGGAQQDSVVNFNSDDV